MGRGDTRIGEGRMRREALSDRKEKQGSLGHDDFYIIHHGSITRKWLKFRRR